jgi:4-hydroxy-3-methylbut-2-enyl diphosphate reductase IspH
MAAGVERAIEIVERALALHGAPIYVRHEVVHNKFVVDSLKAKGAIFVVCAPLLYELWLPADKWHHK